MKTRIGNRRTGHSKIITWDVNENGCWICTSHAPMGKKNFGCPTIMTFAKRVCISRFLWEELFGEIPDKMVIMHKCDTRMCINPEHLQLGTQKQNCLDREVKGRGRKSKKDPETGKFIG